jgi:hypothetical protein
MAPGTQLEIQARHPSATHTVSIAQILRWYDGIAVSPDEVLRRRKAKAMLD